MLQKYNCSDPLNQSQNLYKSPHCPCWLLALPCVSGQLPLPREGVMWVTGTRQCVVCNAGNVKWLLDPFTQGPWDQG